MTRAETLTETTHPPTNTGKELTTKVQPTQCMAELSYDASVLASSPLPGPLHLAAEASMSGSVPHLLVHLVFYGLTSGILQKILREQLDGGVLEVLRAVRAVGAHQHVVELVQRAVSWQGLLVKHIQPRASDLSCMHQAAISCSMPHSCWITRCNTLQVCSKPTFHILPILV